MTNYTNLYSTFSGSGLPIVDSWQVRLAGITGLLDVFVAESSYFTLNSGRVSSWEGMVNGTTFDEATAESSSCRTRRRSTASRR